MKIIISPAKKMRTDTDSFLPVDRPLFLEQAQQICKTMQGMPGDALRRLWNCNEQIARLNIDRLQRMDLFRAQTPAILSYDGIQYKYMAPSVFSDRELEYIRQHLCILSGLYGLLRPFDAVTPYRLEMQAKLQVGTAKNLYEFWGSTLADWLAAQTDCVLNLASKEYSICISKHLPQGVQFLTCVFGEEKDGRIIEKGTICKMARGEMVRYLAERGIEDPAEICTFDRLDYRFAPQHSDADTLVFLRQGKNT